MKRATYILSPFLVLLSACGPPVPDRPDLYVDHGDLGAIRERGALRVLVPTLREDYLPRQGSPAAEERAMARSFARTLGLTVQFIPVASRSELLTLLEWGYGDIVTAQLTVTAERAQRFRFTRPTATVSEWLVGRRGAPDLPRHIEELDGREIHVRKSSAFTNTLERITREHDLKLYPVYVDERLDTETIAYEVSRGERSLTVVDDNLLSTIETYNNELERLMVLAEGRELAWAIRKEATELAAEADSFIIEHYLTDHRVDDRTTGGLDAIRARGSLRVLTLNNPVNYFLYRGRQMGFDYEITRLGARRLDVRLEMVVPPRRDLVFDWLLEGQADLIASTLTVTPERQEIVSFSRPYLFIEEMVVQAASSPDKIHSIEELTGRTIHAWRSSSHYQTLSKLRDILGPFDIIPVPEDMEFEVILDRVADGVFPLAVVDSHILDAELAYRDDVEIAFPLRDPRMEKPPDWHTVVALDKAVAFAVRRDNTKLREFLDELVHDLKGSLEFNVAVNRYFKENRRLPRVKETRAAVSGRLSPYDELFKKHSRRYGLDWRLMVAQAYQESRFDPAARSWAGARGIFQLLPSTGLELGFHDLGDPEKSIHAGIRYMHRLVERMESRIPLKHRLRFALAAYNAGWGHLQDARRLAAEKGWNPDKWFGHTERAMLLLRLPKYYRRSRHGYVRGTEPVRYVSEIQNRYDHYVLLVPH